jgi:hypothetical protein
VTVPLKVNVIGLACKTGCANVTAISIYKKIFVMMSSVWIRLIALRRVVHDYANRRRHSGAELLANTQFDPNGLMLAPLLNAAFPWIRDGQMASMPNAPF